MTRRWCRWLVSSSDIHFVRNEVPTSIGLVFEKLGTGDGSPSLALEDEGEGMNESRNVRAFNFVPRMMRPGERGPASHSLSFSSVVPLVAKLQFVVSRFQIKDVRLNTSGTIARTRLSASP